MNNIWSRVTIELLVSRNKDDIWTLHDRYDNVCKGIMIKYSYGASSAGFLYPIVIVVTNLSKEELPNDQWLVIPIKDLLINCHIDPRNEKVDHVCCIGTNLPQKYYFEWFNDTITYPTIQHIQTKFNPLTTEETQDSSIPSVQEVCM